MKTPPRARARPTPGVAARALGAKATGLGNLFKNETVLLCTHDLEGILLSINEAACTAVGYGRQELLGTSIRDLLAPEWRKHFDDYLVTIRSSEAATGVMTVVTRVGQKRSWHYQNTRDAGGDGRDVVHSTAVDVTELLLAERSALQALRLSEERYRLLFERSLAGIYRTTLDGTFLDCNEACAKILGYSSRHQILETNARELYVFETDREAFLDELRETRRLEGRETCLRGRNGSPVWVIESVSLIEREGDRPEMLEGSIIDLSDRRRAEEAVRKSEERYRFLFEGNPLPMWVYEVDSLRFVDVNDAAVAHYGYSRAEFLSMALPEIWPFEDRDDAVLHPIAQAAPKPQPFTASRHLLKNGRVAFVEVSAVDLPGGPVRRRMALARDVTEQKAAELALIESEKKFRHIFDLAPVGIYQITPDGRILTVNPAFARMLGYETPEELISGHTAHDFYFQPGDRAEAIHEFAKSRQPRATIERRLKNRAGDPVWLRITAQTFLNETSSIEYFEGFTFDITEKKRVDEQQARLQEAVLETARQWRDTFDAIDTPVLVVDADAIVKRLNRAAVELTGQTYVEVLGRPLDSLARGELWTTAADLVRSPESGAALAGVLCRDETAQKVWEISVSKFRTSESGDSPMSIVIARDVTPIVKLQESVHRAESMSSMGSLVAGVAHEVRNPLFAISATLDAFDLRFQDRDDYKKYGLALRTQLDRMNHLMRDLLDYGRPVVLEFRDVEPGELVRDAIRGCSDLAARKEVPVRIDVPDGLPSVHVDRGRTVQIFVNLIENAIQHASGGSPISVIAVSAASSGRPGVLFSVEDSGPGFLAADIPKLFDPFFTRRQGGTGLGLAIVQRIVEEHGGTVTPANRPEGGARVAVWLPCESPEPAGNERER